MMGAATATVTQPMHDYVNKSMFLTILLQTKEGTNECTANFDFLEHSWQNDNLFDAFLQDSPSASCPAPETFQPDLTPTGDKKAKGHSAASENKYVLSGKKTTLSYQCSDQWH